MNSELTTSFTVEDVSKGFFYSTRDSRGLFGMGGKLTIQPDYQRNYIYGDGVMGVPISFLDKYNPDQFEIVGMFTGGNGVGFIPGSATPIASGKYTTAPVINKQKVYARILIKNK